MEATLPKIEAALATGFQMLANACPVDRMLVDGLEDEEFNRQYSGDCDVVPYKPQEEGAFATQPIGLIAWLLKGEPQRYVDKRCTCFFSVSFLVLLGACLSQPMLEVRMLWSARQTGVTVDLSKRSLVDIFGYVVSAIQPHIAVILVLMNVVLPLLYVGVLLVLAACPTQFRRAESKQNAGEGAPYQTGAEALRLVFGTVASILRPWVTTDVFTIATLIFLCTVQDAATVTSMSGGSYTFFAFLGVGFSCFALRWFVEVSPAEARWGSALPVIRTCMIIVTWSLLCVLLARGVAGSTSVAAFPTLDSVCDNIMPVLNDTLSRAAPASYGDCGNHATAPPQPCKGTGPLLNQTHKSNSGFNQAVWLGGIDTISLDRCHLWRSEPPASSSNSPHDETRMYRLKIGGQFESLRLFLHVRQCGPFGCSTVMNSSDNCCGDKIRFHFTLSMPCRPSQGDDAFRDVVMEKFEIDPMLVEQRFMRGALKVDAMDIAPQVEKVVTEQTKNFMGKRSLEWAGAQVSIPQLLNRLISYNSPAAAGAC